MTTILRMAMPHVRDGRGWVLAADMRRCLTSLSAAREMLSELKGGAVKLEKDDASGIASIIISNPEKKNAMSGQMMVDLGDIVTDLEGWSRGRGVMLYGTGDSFCSGGDLDMMRSLMSDKSKCMLMSGFMQNTLQRLFNLPLISVALVHGNSLGGGSELFTACDFRVVSERVSIGFVQTKLGLIPGWGGGTRLVRLLGRHTTLELLSSAKILSWREAMAIGLADAVIHDTDYETFITNGKEWLLKHLPKSPQVSQAVKSMVTAVQTETNTEKCYEAEKKLFASVFGEPAHFEAMTGTVKHK